jgi:NADPH-dependent 2,4-dienoyl-CoA reductase/sulfur reductase-like enzyme
MSLVDLFKINPRAVCYMDTDSIITTEKLPAELIDDNVLGKIKLEGTWDRGIFLGAKMYFLENATAFVAHLKGINTNKLTNRELIKSQFETILNKGSV